MSLGGRGGGGVSAWELKVAVVPMPMRQIAVLDISLRSSRGFVCVLLVLIDLCLCKQHMSSRVGRFPLGLSDWQYRSSPATRVPRLRTVNLEVR